MHHFLANVHVRNEKRTLATTLSQRLASTGRNYKTFTIKEEINWNKYVITQLGNQLLAEQRRAANMACPKALFIFDVMRDSSKKSNRFENSHLFV